MYKTIGYTALTACVFMALNCLCHRATDGYFPYEIPASFPTHPEWEVSIDEATLLLNQPYYYLGKGHQCFVFESKDGQSILKFPFHSQVVPPFWIRPIPGLSKAYHAKHMHKKQRKIEQDAISYVLAYQHLKQDTGVHYIHLNRTEQLLPFVKVYDKIGVEHTLCLDHMEFILQNKAQLLFDTIDEWMQAGQIEKTKQGLLSLIGLFERRFALGIEDREYVLDSNYGFVQQQAMMIDIGRLRRLETPLSKEAQAAMIWGVFSPLCAYLDQHYPELSDFLKNEQILYTQRT